MGRALRRALLVAVLALVVTSCGLDDEESSAADALAGALGRGQASESVKDSSDCVADKWVGQTGTKPLVADGLLTEDLKARPTVLAGVQSGRRPVSAKVAEAYAAAWIACVDLDAVALDRKTDTGASEEELDEYADCLKQVDDDQWRQAIADEWAGRTQSAGTADLQQDLAECEQELGGS